VRYALDNGATHEQLRTARGGTLAGVPDTIVEHVWDGQGQGWSRRAPAAPWMWRAPGWSRRPTVSWSDPRGDRRQRCGAAWPCPSLDLALALMDVVVLVWRQEKGRARW